ncbi:hypothetical protein BKA67DRAFT_530303 [Truncatella angustata]|uniref:Uncharacterized protein n=1 Tax=Truncatella angustata TaxID=152316 RepID=A0A9P8UY65_9PEZI|nr:uncharacterized protein BKA67DRAFT_530303 [Truncatella angustata]KAH6660186.1 hypothetical protein BKA67DRAFT_530303 [Truncatella angustata]
MGVVRSGVGTSEVVVTPTTKERRKRNQVSECMGVILAGRTDVRSIPEAIRKGSGLKRETKRNRQDKPVPENKKPLVFPCICTTQSEAEEGAGEGFRPTGRSVRQAEVDRGPSVVFWICKCSTATFNCEVCNVSYFLFFSHIGQGDEPEESGCAEDLFSIFVWIFFVMMPVVSFKYNKDDLLGLTQHASAETGGVSSQQTPDASPSAIQIRDYANDSEK